MKKAAMDSGSHKVQHYLETISNHIEIIWSTTTVKTKNSTNLESGRRPKFKSAKFFVFTLTVNELLKCEKAAFHFHAALFGVWGARSQLELPSKKVTLGRGDIEEGYLIYFWMLPLGGSHPVDCRRVC